MRDIKKELEVEREELQNKKNKLQDFLMSDVGLAMDAHDRADLMDQFGFMHGYSGVLTARIMKLTPA